VLEEGYTPPMKEIYQVRNKGESTWIGRRECKYAAEKQCPLSGRGLYGEESEKFDIFGS
jgi:hypothetical protein